MKPTRAFTPSHPAVCPCLKSRIVWNETNITFVGGAQISDKWFKYRFNQVNESPTLALIASDFQQKN